MGGMWQHSSPAGTTSSPSSLFERLIFRHSVFSPAQLPLNLHEQLRFTLDLYSAAEDLGLIGTKADLLEMLHVDSRLAHEVKESLLPA